MNNLCIDIGYNFLNKYGEELCGDHIEVVNQGENSTVMVLADGLGSGVKANILSTLTSTIISTMMANAMSIEDCVNTIVSTLPVCEVRQIAYSTFTIIRIVNNEEVEFIEYDNPHLIFLREGKNYEIPKTCETIEGKRIFKSKVKLRIGDTFMVMSDGAVHAGVGKTLNFGWQRDNIIEFMETMYSPEYTAKTLSTILLDECNELYKKQPGDDTTVCTIRICKRTLVNLMIGPPAKLGEEEKMMSMFFSSPGKHIICGGTTSTLAAEHLGKPLQIGYPLYIDPEIPPTAAIDGVDLVTEGVITINKVLLYARDYLAENSFYIQWGCKKDAASRVARLLFEDATDINFFVGKAVNPAHQNPDLPIGFSIKMRLVEELSECLKKMGKRIKVTYF